MRNDRVSYFGDRVKKYMTFNEPTCFIAGFATGTTNAPGEKDIGRNSTYVALSAVGLWKSLSDHETMWFFGYSSWNCTAGDGLLSGNREQAGKRI